MQLGQQVPPQQQVPQQQGYPGGGQQPGWAAEPQAGPVVPGYAGQPRSGPMRPQPQPQRRAGRRAQRAVGERVMPALAASHATMLREQIAIAERHPDFRACLNDGVIFLAGGSRVLPMPDLSKLTVPQSDALAAQLRQ